MKSARACRYALSALPLAFTLILLSLSSTPLSAAEGDAAPAALQGMTLRPAYTPSRAPRVAVIHASTGDVWVARPAVGEAYAAETGDPVHQGEAVHTAAGARCRIRFSNGDVVSIAPETHFVVERVEDRRDEGKKGSFFRMLRGKAVFYALRLFRYREVRFQVATPTAVAGVRGTKFGVHVFEDPGGPRAEGPLRVTAAGRDLGVYLAQAGGSPSGLITVFACADGSLNVTDPLTGAKLAEVGAHETFNSQTRETRFDPQDRTLGGMETDTRLPGQEEAVSGPDDQGDDTAGIPGQEDGQSFAVQAADTTDVVTLAVLQQGAEETQETQGPVEEEGFQSLPPPLKGYFSGLLMLHTSSTVWEAFSSMALQDRRPLPTSPGYAESRGVNHGSDIFALYEGSDVHANIYTLGGWKTPQVVEGPTTFLGQFDYLQWGYHESATPPITYALPAGQSELLNKIWFVEGIPTPASELSSISDTYHYSGDVFGTYSPDMSDLSGSYSCSVNFGTSQVQNFAFTAQGGGHTVQFTQSGSLTMSANGEFALLDPGDGTLKIDGSNADYFTVSGAHFGTGADKASEQGGTWAGYRSGTDVGAWGGFAGKKSSP